MKADAFYKQLIRKVEMLKKLALVVWNEILVDYFFFNAKEKYRDNDCSQLGYTKPNEHDNIDISFLVRCE